MLSKLCSTTLGEKAQRACDGYSQMPLSHCCGGLDLAAQKLEASP